TATRQCMPNGQWFVHPDLNVTWSNYSSCKNSPDAQDEEDELSSSKVHVENIKFIYSTGYGISLFALGIAIFIMIYFKRLHCPRNTLHIHLFTAFVLRALLSFLKDTLLVEHLGFRQDLILINGSLAFDPDSTVSHDEALRFLASRQIMASTWGSNSKSSTDKFMLTLGWVHHTI
ncbi:parathyroid hormone/parathyroid hormone-related peptide receptor, partial [Plakobranchus ocellatus]